MVRKKPDAAVGDLAQALGLFVRRIRAAAASHGLSLTEGAVLGRLEREGSMTTAELARAESVKPQSMGTTVAALEEMGFIERKPHPTDGRQMMISLTERGRAVRQSVRAAKHGWLGQAIAGLDEEDRETLFRAGDIIRKLAAR
jgi:DNA-binding MarR family transcriptional regulator